MSCPNRCSNDFKVKNIPDQIECVVSNKIKSNDGLPVTNLPEGLSTVSDNTHLKAIDGDGAVSGSKNVGIQTSV